MMIRLFQGIMTLSLLLILGGCSVRYSATGASIEPGAKSVNVRFIDNRAPIVNPTLSQNLTERLRNKVQAQTKLVQINEDGTDYEFKGAVTGYSFSNAAVTNVDQAATSRLTVTVNITFVKRIGDKKRLYAVVHPFSGLLSLPIAKCSGKWPAGKQYPATNSG